MPAPEVDRLRADVAVLERRLERLEKAVALSSETVSTLRRRLEDLPSGGGGGHAQVHAPPPAPAPSFDARPLEDEIRATRVDVRAMDERVAPLEDGLGVLRREIAALRETVAKLAEGPRAVPAQPAERAPVTVAAPSSVAAVDPMALTTPAPAPVVAPRAADRAPAPAPVVAARPVDRAPAAAPVVTSRPADLDLGDPATDPGADPPTMPRVSAPAGARRTVEEPLANAQWSASHIEVGRPIRLTCDAPGHPDGWPIEVVVVDAAGNRVAALDGEVSAETVEVEWTYRYEEDPNTDRQRPEMCFIARAGEQEVSSPLVPVKDYAPPPKRRGFADLLRSKGGRS